MLSNARRRTNKQYVPESTATDEATLVGDTNNYNAIDDDDQLCVEDVAIDLPSEIFNRNFQPMAESTNAAFDSIPASTTCVRMERIAKELRNVRISEG